MSWLALLLAAAASAANMEAPHPIARIGAALQAMPAGLAGPAQPRLARLDFALKNGQPDSLTAQTLAPIVAKMSAGVPIDAAIREHTAQVNAQAAGVIDRYLREEASPAQYGRDAEVAEGLLRYSRDFLDARDERALKAIKPELADLASRPAARIDAVERGVIAYLEANPKWGDPEWLPFSGGKRQDTLRVSPPRAPGLSGAAEPSGTQRPFVKLAELLLEAETRSALLERDAPPYVGRLCRANELLRDTLRRAAVLAEHRYSSDPHGAHAYYARWREAVRKLLETFQMPERPSGKRIREIAAALKPELERFQRDVAAVDSGVFGAKERRWAPAEADELLYALERAADQAPF